MRAGIVGMMRRWLLVVLLLLGYRVPALAGIGDWKNYTDMRSVRAVAPQGSSLWAATAGGVFRFDPDDSTYLKLLNSDGLSSNDATAIVVDNAGRIWIGQQSGTIDQYDPAARQWRSVTDISRSTKTNKKITAFHLRGDTLFIGTGFGVALFSVSRFEFIDTFTGFGSGVSQPVVNAVHRFQNRIFLATNSGIIASKTGAVNLADPSSWSVDQTAGLAANAFAEFNGALYVSSSTGLYILQGNAWGTVNNVTSSVRIIASADTGLIYTQGNLLMKVPAAPGSHITLSTSIPGVVTGGTITPGGSVVLGFTDAGIGVMNSAQQWPRYAPNGPNSNSFYKMVVDQKGDLWSASGGHTGGWGFYRFDRTTWTNYTTSNTPLLLTNDCYAIAVGPNNSKWVSTWGEGAVVVNSNGDVVRRFDYTHPGFIGVIRSGSGGIPSYTVPSKAVADDSGNVWIAGVFTTDRSKTLWKMRPDSSWEVYPGLPVPMDNGFMYEIAIDRFNTKWFTNSLISRQESPVVAYYNPQRFTNSWGSITESDGMTDDRVQAVAVDQQGDIWLGTGAGITIINEPLNPVQRISKVFDFSVRDLFINCIAVDPLNNKWVGTSRGVFVIAPDGVQQLQHYSVENTGGKLVDNNIYSIAIDGLNGIVYIGTEKGLSSLEIAAVNAKNNFSTIELSPNPVYLPNHRTVEIRGLVADCTVKVMDLSGKVIRQFPAQGGGRAFWDCRDGEGREVGTGVYIIAAHTSTGEKTALAKVAVIRK
ncbi:MAG: hypothetical protein HUU02_01230 [Bacteroidetes bacterium]|nr:hypothetical protein [Bacteroidota bacterium]